MDYSKRCVTFKLGIYDYSYGIKIVNFIKTFVLIIHFFIYAVNGFYATFKCAFYSVFVHFFMNKLSCLVYKVTIFTEFSFYICAYFLISYGIKIRKRKIFKFLLDSLHTEPVCKRSVNMHCFKRYRASLVLRLSIECTHIVQAVGKLYKYYPHVFCHCKKHLAKALHMCVLFVFDTDLDKFRQPVDKFCNLWAEFFFNFLNINFICTVFKCVMKQRSAYRIGIKL